VFSWMVILVIFVDLFLFSFVIRGFRSSLSVLDDVVKRTEEAELLGADTSIYRIYNFQMDEAENALQPNLNMHFNIDNVGVYSPLIFRRYFNLLQDLGCVDDSTGVSIASETALFKNLKMLSMLNVKYIISAKVLDNEELSLVKITGDGKKIYLNKGFLPRAFVVKHARAVKDEARALELVRSQSFRPSEILVCEGDLPFRLDSATGRGAQDEVKIKKYTDRDIVIRARLGEDGVLVLSDYFYPGWKCYVDGMPTRIFRVNYILRGVYMQKGEHRVEFIYPGMLALLDRSP